MLIMAEPNGYQEPPSGPENMRRNFCSAWGAEVIRKIDTKTIANKIKLLRFILPPSNSAGLLLVYPILIMVA
jgi:hypothetical protein